MLELTCAACQKSVPMRDAYSAAGQTLCGPCVQRFIAERGGKKPARGEIVQQIDPTICAHCGADGGSTEWPKIADLPACSKCEGVFRNWPYPRWLKIAFAVFLCMAVAAFIYNLRFFLAYVDLLKGQRAVDAGNVELGMSYFTLAADRLPEVKELSAVPNLYRASVDAGRRI